MRNVRWLVAWGGLLLALGCGGDDNGGGTKPPPPSGEDLQVQGPVHWWNDQVFYEVFVRSFQDSDGDGVGDIQGLISRLDYLNDGNPATTDDLGVTALWLMPIVDSPSYHGYYATDYRNVNPDYGTNADFQELMSEAHARGMRVIVDYVMNHCSSQHPWFVAARAGDPQRRDWYRWSTSHPGYSGPWGQPVWHSSSGGYFYGLFWSGMPDLNYANPDVEEEMFDTATFWLQDMGADGFRLDAVKYMLEDGATLENIPATYDFWSRFRSHLDTVAPDAYAVGEAWDRTDIVLRYIDAGLHTCFEFDLASATVDAAESGAPGWLMYKVETVGEEFPFLQYATFLANHDQNRVRDQLGDVEGRNMVAASMLLTLPGVPYLYYGEETGMRGTKPDEDIRRPMQWTPGANAGFTTGSPWNSLNNDYVQWNVETLAADPGSLWNRYREMVQARVASAALRRGTYHTLKATNSSIYAFLRRFEGDAVVAVHNLRSGTVGGWTLSALASQLPAGDYDAVDLVTGEELNGVTIGTNGTLAGWGPQAVLLGYESLLVRLTPRPVPAANPAP